MLHADQGPDFTCHDNSSKLWPSFLIFQMKARNKTKLRMNFEIFTSVMSVSEEGNTSFYLEDVFLLSLFKHLLSPGNVYIHTCAGIC